MTNIIKTTQNTFYSICKYTFDIKETTTANGYISTNIVHYTKHDEDPEQIIKQFENKLIENELNINKEVKIVTIEEVKIGVGKETLKECFNIEQFAEDVKNDFDFITEEYDEEYKNYLYNMTTIDLANWYIEGIGGIENIPKDIIINCLD